MRGNVGARVVPASHHGGGHESHAPVLGLQLQRVAVWPDGQHGLGGEAAANLGEAEVERQATGEDLARDLVGAVDDLLQVAEGVGGVVELVHERLQAGEERVGGFLDFILDKGAALLLFYDCINDGGHAVEDWLADSRWLACRLLVYLLHIYRRERGEMGWKMAYLLFGPGLSQFP